MLNIVFDPTTEGRLYEVAYSNSNSELNEQTILCFEWMLDIGFLNEGIDSEYRNHLPGKLIMQGFSGEESSTGIPEIAEKNQNNMHILLQGLQKGESVRIWYGDDPHSLCGFYQMCALLKRFDNPIYAMFAPKYTTGKKDWYLVNGWGQFPSEAIGELISIQRLMNKKEIQLYAKHWEKLTKENTVLRANISGFPVSVDEDFYDRFIERSLPDEPIKEALVIENVICNNNLRVYVSYLELRIQKMIDKGKIKVLSAPDDEAMHRIIQKNQEIVAMKAKLFYFPSCPYCVKAKRAIEELKEENPEYQKIEIEWVNEHIDSALADQYDYYYVPTIFYGEEKLYEASPAHSYEDIRENIERAFQYICKKGS